jgi:hypothetical protein
VHDETFVVIPFKDHWAMTRDLVDQLLVDDAATAVLLFDNGSAASTRAEAAGDLTSRPTVELIDAAGWSLHQMWNAGVRDARRRRPVVNIAILNNDLRVGPRFLAGLAAGLRADPTIVAVCPNYDGRPSGDGLVPLRGICEGRYDTSGGLSGFAFVLKGEWFAGGWQFPEDARWWFGDALLTLALDRAGCRYAMVTDVFVEHLGGGSQTGDWDSAVMRAQIDADRAAYHRHLDAPTTT